VTAHFAEPSVDGLPARGDPGIADTRVFGEHALVANGPDMHTVAVALEEQPVSLANAQKPANFDGDGDLAFARDFGLLLHGGLVIPYFITFFLTLTLPNKRRGRDYSLPRLFWLNRRCQVAPGWTAEGGCPYVSSYTSP